MLENGGRPTLLSCARLKARGNIKCKMKLISVPLTSVIFWPDELQFYFVELVVYRTEILFLTAFSSPFCALIYFGDHDTSHFNAGQGRKYKNP